MSRPDIEALAREMQRFVNSLCAGDTLSGDHLSVLDRFAKLVSGLSEPAAEADDCRGCDVLANLDKECDVLRAQLAAARPAK